MKNEKVNLTDEEKIKKSFKIYGEIAEGIETIFIVGSIIIMAIAGIIVFSGKNELPETVNEAIYTTEDEVKDIPLKIWNEFFELIGGEENEQFNEMPIFVQMIKIISLIAKYIFTILIIDNLKKMFKEIAQNAKPFTENNIKKLNIISWLIFGLWVATNQGVGIMSVISIFALNQVFKHGYKLQIESDETL